MIKRILIIFISIIIMFSGIVNGFYSYENRFTIFNITRNSNKANYTISYKKDSITNQDVEVKIEFDKMIDIIGDNKNFLEDNSKKIITKTLKENEKNKLLIRDEDFNYQEIEYDVDWIDKIPPVISGAENSNIYNRNVHLDYKDNKKIKEIYADYYSDSFSIFTGEEEFYEAETLQMVPECRNSITVYVTSNTKQMEKYRYYMDDVLYATTHDKKYTFTGLEYPSGRHKFVVEALDRNGNVLDSKEVYRNTIPIKGVEFSYASGIKYVSLKRYPETATSVRAFAWVENHKNETYQELVILNDEEYSGVVGIDMGRFNSYVGRYVVDFLIDYIDTNGSSKRLEIIGSVYMPNNYRSDYYSGLPNDFTGNRKLLCKMCR